jgi:hypothetical protein
VDGPSKEGSSVGAPSTGVVTSTEGVTECAAIGAGYEKGVVRGVDLAKDPNPRLGRVVLLSSSSMSSLYDKIASYRRCDAHLSSMAEKSIEAKNESYL